MCLFITVLLPKDTDIEALKPIYKKYGMKFYPRDSTDALTSLRPNDKCFDPHLHAHCDCNTDLGSWRKWKKFAESGRKRLLEARRLEKTSAWFRFKKKLSEKRGKVDFSMVDAKELGLDYDISKGPPDWEAIDLHEWLGLIKDVLGTGLTDHVGLVLHWASGQDLAPEVVEDVRKVSLKETTEDMLLHIDYEVLYEFVKE